MNKYELKYMYEQEATKVENLIDINGKNAHHIQDLYAEIKKKDENMLRKTSWLTIHPEFKFEEKSNPCDLS